jgi:hypothetical protein
MTVEWRRGRSLLWLITMNTERTGVILSFDTQKQHFAIVSEPGLK